MSSVTNTLSAGTGRTLHGKDESAQWYSNNQKKIQLHPEARAYIEKVLWS